MCNQTRSRRSLALRWHSKPISQRYKEMPLFPPAGLPESGEYSPSCQDSAPQDYNPPPPSAPDDSESIPDSGGYWPPDTSSEVSNNASPVRAKDMLIGLSVGIGTVVLLVVVGVFFILRRKRTRRNRGVPPLQRPTDDPVASTEPQHRQSNAPPPTENEVAMQLKPTSPEIVSTNQLLPGCVPPPRETPSTSGSLGSEKPLPSISHGNALSFTNSTFTYEELAMATHSFSDANFLGQGGFGYVHKGVLPSGKQVAIKQLKSGSVQGEHEFRAEVEIISRVHHRHLVSLVGYCASGSHRMLVYEFVPNNTLEFHLYDKLMPTMSWATRMKIALGSAKGLAYLHEDCQPKIIHRDIKAANILLDHNFEAKVADFGLAKIVIDDDTHISTQIKGTFGYLAPEYASSGKLTDKSDVFSFGVVLLELITGRRPIDKTHSFREDSMVDWARPLLAQAREGGSFDSFVDQRLHDYNSSEMARMVACAAVCVHHSTWRRPRMSQIVLALEGHITLDDLNERISPGRNTMYNLQEDGMTKPRK